MAIGRTNVGGGAGLPAGWSEKMTGVAFTDIEKDQPIEMRRVASLDSGATEIGLVDATSYAMAYPAASRDGLTFACPTPYVSGSYQMIYGIAIFKHENGRFRQVQFLQPKPHGETMLSYTITKLLFSYDGAYMVMLYNYKYGTGPYDNSNYCSIFKWNGTQYVYLKDITNFVQSNSMIYIGRDVLIGIRNGGYQGQNLLYIYNINDNFDILRYETQNNTSSYTYSKSEFIFSPDEKNVLYVSGIYNENTSVSSKSFSSMNIASGTTGIYSGLPSVGSGLYYFSSKWFFDVTGQYLLIKKEGESLAVYKLTGMVFALVYTFPSNTSGNEVYAVSLRDGVHFLVSRYNNDLWVYRRSGDTFSLTASYPLSSIPNSSRSDEIVSLYDMFMTMYQSKPKTFSTNPYDAVLPASKIGTALYMAIDPLAFYGIGRSLSSAPLNAPVEVELFRAYNDAVRGGMQQMMAMAAMLPGADEKILALEYENLLLKGGLEL